MALQSVNMNDETWERLLALRLGAVSLADDRSDAYALYAPIAEARGPFVLAQVGQSLDGRIATPAGDARDVSGPDGLAHLHRCRALVDAVLVGEATVKADNPRLSVRIVSGSDPVRVVVDCHAKLTGEEGIFNDGGAPVIVFQNEEAPERKLGSAEVIGLPVSATGLQPHAILEALSARGLTRILVEGGARTIARFIEAGLIDRLHVAVSPIIIGSGPSGISLPPIERLSTAHRPETHVYSLGSDILFDCVLKPSCQSGREGQDIGVANLA